MCNLSDVWRLSAITTVLIAVVLASAERVPACTTAVISGRATADGRPLLWKNRDAPNQDNEVRLFSDGTFRCVAVVNAGSSSSVWMGVNEAGLCIENSLSKDLNDSTGGKGLGNGSFMLHVLQNCATVGDVEMFLEETDKTGRATVANFGVIDAAGGAVLFETGPTSHRKFDANDPEVAPKGYVVRSNFSYTAQDLPIDVEAESLRDADLYSAGRFVRGCRLMEEGLATGGLTPRYLLRSCCRDLADDQCEAISGSVNASPGLLPEAIDTESTINRTTTVSAVVFQGVKPGEDPLLSTMWVLLGSPNFTVAVPCWVSAETVALELDGPKTSELCDLALQLRNAHYEDKHTLRTDRMPVIWSETWSTEDEICDEVERELATWRKSTPSPDKITELHEHLTRKAFLSVYELAKSVEEAEVSAAAE